MTEEAFNKLRERSLKYTLISLIQNTNGLEVSEEEKDIILNEVLNIISNIVDDESSGIWQDAILDLATKSKEMTSKENMADIMKQIKEIKDGKDK